MHILYSAGTRLAYLINQKYYGGLHYVWCAPAPDSDPIAGRNPPTSDPWKICRDLADHVTKADRHSPLIASNRAGIIRGAAARCAQGAIDSATMAVIEEIANKAEIADFVPIFMVIPYSEVKDLVNPVGISSKATALSQEFIISDLPRDKFDVWKWID